MNSNCGFELYWHNCYTGGFDLLTEESVAHPAKMSPALCYRILEHLEELGLLKEDSTVLDPMAGTGMTNLCAGAKGYKTIGVELEPKFIGFQKDNKQYVENRIYRKLDWQIIQGDSRRLSELLIEKGLVSITSPPYEQTLKDGKPIAERTDKTAQMMRAERPNTYETTGAGASNRGYGTTEGQIGNLKDTPLKTIVSPPYAGGAGHGGQPTELDDQKHITEWVREQYGDTKGQIENLPDKPLKTIVSPPYGNPRDTTEEYDDKYDLRRPPGVKWGRESFRGRYGETEGQIGDLENKPLKTITSPPYEECQQYTSQYDDNFWAIQAKRGVYPTAPSMSGVGQLKKSPDSIDNLKQETYLSAMKQVYSEIAKVSDVLVVVVKNPTRNGKLRRLDLDTIKIMELAGWTIHCQHRALLFEELEQETLFGDKTKKIKGRMSFFKRLAWDKGSPVASWEDIIISVR